MDGLQILISPFASQKDWWETPGVGFMNHVKKRPHTCRWGIVLFQVPASTPKGFWIEGVNFEKALKFPNTFTKSNLTAIEATTKNVVQKFSDAGDLLNLI